MKVFAVVFLGILCIAHEAKAQFSSCLNPNQRSGVCILIKQCQSLYSVLQQNRLTDSQKQFIRSSACGMSADGQPFVCCTEDTGYITRTQRVRPSFSDYDDDWENPFTFPNQRVSRPWSFGQQQASDRNSVQTSTFKGADGSKLLPQPPSCGGEANKNRIYDGEDADLNEFPWMVLLECRRHSDNELVTICGGSLINQRYVLTAAHCLKGRFEQTVGPLVSVRLGEHDTRTAVDCPAGGGRCSPKTQRLGFEEIRVHEKYSAKSGNYLHDIGLIRLERNVQYTDNIRPICLPSSVGPEVRRPGMVFTVAGWGQTSNLDRSPIKQKVEVNYLDLAKCRQKFATKRIAIESTQLCAGGLFGQDTCKGDSGGPLMRFRGNSWVLEGIVSLGHECGLLGWGWPGVNTDVSAYDIWIKQNVRA